LSKSGDSRGVIFSSRGEAGRKLGLHLAELGVQPDVVLGLPRGGVVVAAQVARVLHRPLDALVVRKLGHPRHREFAVGALAEDGIVLLDQEVMKETHVTRAALQEVIAEETMRLSEYQSKFHRTEPPALSGKTVLIVDDGLATGATAEAALMSAKGREALKVFIAIPVASTSAFDRLKAASDGVIALSVDPNFAAVGQYYAVFPQTNDEEVLALLDTQA